MPIQVSFSTDNLTPEEARWIASLVQPAEVDFSKLEPGISEYLRATFGRVGGVDTRDPEIEAAVARNRSELYTVVAPTETSGATLEVNNGEPKIVLPPATSLAEETVEGHIAEVAAIPATDSTGLPWDERIHASSKALNADGSWRTRRGVDKAFVASVEAELRGAQIDAVNEVVAEVTGQTDAQVVGYVPEAQLPEAAQEAKTETVVPPPPPPAPLAPAKIAEAPAAPSPTNAPAAATSPFVALMKRVTTAQSAGKLTQPRVKELLESLDKKSIMDLRTDTDALDAFAVLLDGEGV